MTIAAAGAVVWRPASDDVADGVELVLVHRPRYDDWSLPKGKLESGEPTRAAAVREVREETGLRVALGRSLVRVRYRAGRDAKKVDYFAARVLDGSFEPSDEVDKVRWCTPAEAAELLTYDADRRVLASFGALPADLTTLLLVRHAKAGRRDDWDGPDSLRPLSRTGERQVPPVRAMAEWYGVDHVHSAPLVRCVRTVQPVADDLDTKVVEEPALAELEYEGREETAKLRLLEIAAEDGVPIVCSQGGVIPDLVSRVADGSGLPLRRVEAKKGSVWALFFAAGQLVAADYLPRPAE